MNGGHPNNLSAAAGQIDFHRNDRGRRRGGWRREESKYARSVSCGSSEANLDLHPTHLRITAEKGCL